jgi:hypothetical protein
MTTDLFSLKKLIESSADGVSFMGTQMIQVQVNARYSWDPMLLT